MSDDRKDKGIVTSGKMLETLGPVLLLLIWKFYSFILMKSLELPEMVWS